MPEVLSQALRSNEQSIDIRGETITNQTLKMRTLFDALHGAPQDHASPACCHYTFNRIDQYLQAMREETRFIRHVGKHDILLENDKQQTSYLQKYLQ